MSWIGPLITALGSLVGGGIAAKSQKKAGATQAKTEAATLAEQRRQFDQSMDWMRESARTAQTGTELENIRRSQEAQARAARLEDVAKMFEGLDYSAMRGDTAALRGMAAQIGGIDYSGLRNISSSLSDVSSLNDLVKRISEMDYSELGDISKRLGETGGLEAVIGRLGQMDYSTLGQISETLRDTSGLASLAEAARAGDFTQLNQIVGLLGDSPELRAVLANTAGIDTGQMNELINRAANVEGFERISGQLEDVSQLESIAGTLLSRNDVADLRKSAMTNLEAGSEGLNALLAQQGLRGSGFAAQQQRKLAAETMGGLASEISRQRTEALGMAAGVMGQAAGQRGAAAQVLGQGGQQVLGAGSLAGARVGAEQQTMGLQADLARAIGGERAAAGGLAAQGIGLEQAGVGMSANILNQIAQQMGVSASVLAQQLGLEQSGMGMEMAGLEQLAQQLGMSSQVLAQQLGLQQSGMGMEAGVLGQVAQQLGMSGDQLARALGLEQQGMGMQVDALSRALSGEQGIAGLDLQRISEMGRLFQDEAFGANLPYNPAELEALYKEMTGREAYGSPTPGQPFNPEAPATSPGAGQPGAGGGAEGMMYTANTELDEEGKPRKKYDTFGDFLSDFKSAPGQFSQGLQEFLGSFKQPAQPIGSPGQTGNFTVGMPTDQRMYPGGSPGFYGGSFTSQIMPEFRTPASQPVPPPRQPVTRNVPPVVNDVRSRTPRLY